MGFIGLKSRHQHSMAALPPNILEENLSLPLLAPKGSLRPLPYGFFPSSKLAVASQMFLTLNHSNTDSWKHFCDYIDPPG